MKERPIIFSAPMVLAILEGRKTQTRRVIKPQPVVDERDGCWYPRAPKRLSHVARDPDGACRHYGNEKHLRQGLAMGFCPYGAPGDRLWVRETWAPLEDLAENLTRKPPRVIGYWADKSVRWYRSDGTWFTPDSSGWNWNHDCAARRPSVHMPRWASRITLEITEVRVERVRDITLEDINAEGAPGNGLTGDPWQEFADLWNSLNAGGGFGWDKNPWVWVIGFRRAEP